MTSAAVAGWRGQITRMTSHSVSVIFGIGFMTTAVIIFGLHP